VPWFDLSRIGCISQVYFYPNFSEEELLWLHLAIICLPKEVQLSCLPYEQPYKELERRHGNHPANPFCIFDALAKYPILKEQMDKWLDDRTYGGTK